MSKLLGPVRHGQKRLHLFVFGVLGVAVLTAFAAVPAQAHKICAGHSGGGHACMRDGADAGTTGHEYVDICDSQADGNYVYVRAGTIFAGAVPAFTSRASTHTGTNGYDINGSTAGCSTYDYSQMRSYSPWNWYGMEPYGLSVCIQNEGCGVFTADDGTYNNGPDAVYQPYSLPRVAP